MAKTRSGIANMDGSQEGKRYLFAIAIDEYDEANGYAPLQNPVSDVTEVAGLLQQEYGYELICPLLTNGAAKRGDILDKLDEIALEKGDTLVILYSGHGNLIGDEGQWAVSDSKLNSRSSHISASEVMDRLDKLVNAQHIFLILDCCFPGGIFKSRYIVSDNFDGMADTNRSRLVLASGKYKPVLDGEAGKHSPFAKELISVLNSNKGQITDFELFKKLKDNLKKTGSVPILDSMDLASAKGGVFTFAHKDYDAQKPDVEALKQAIFEIDYPSDWWKEMRAVPKQFNIFALQGKPESGHILAAKRFIKQFFRQSNHFECFAFTFGSSNLAVKSLWEEFGRQYNLLSGDKLEIAKAIYQVTLDKNCIFFISIPNDSQFPGVENIVEEFWDELQANIKQVAAQLEPSLGNNIPLNHFFLFVLDKRGMSDIAYRLNVKEPFANKVSPKPIPEFDLADLDFWYTSSRQNELLYKGGFRTLDFSKFRKDQGDFFPQNTILKICKLCLFPDSSSPYQQIFEKENEL